MNSILRDKTNSWFHPALQQLHGFQLWAKLSQIADRVRTPHRRGLVILSILLGCVWLGQAVAGILFREAADPERIRFWIPAAMATYSLFHLFKILTRTVEPPFQWTAAEQELLQAAPLTRVHLIVYRFRSVVVAAIAKAMCFALVMIPDVPSVAMAMVGMLGGLLLVDCVRMAIEIVVHAMTERERWLCRIGILGPAIGLVGYTFMQCLIGTAANTSPLEFSISLTVQVGQTLLGLLQVEPCCWLVEPFRIFSSVVFCEGGPVAILGSILVAAVILIFVMVAVVCLDRISVARCRRLEFHRWQRIDSLGKRSGGSSSVASRSSTKRTKAPPFYAGAGPIAWRQLLGAWHYRGAVRFALLVPTLLCCVPMFANADQTTMMMNIGGSLVFYTFLLLPSGLILDYRRDIDRLSVLKSLPISPWALTIGQLATPVMLASVFQAAVVAIGVATGSISILQASVTLVVLLPFNVLNFALENYLFILSPYRRNEEGIMVFVRTILTFTAKGLLFAIAFAITIGWVIVALTIGTASGLGHWAGALLFAIGIWLIVGASAVAVATLLTKRVAEFDVTIDSPASS